MLVTSLRGDERALRTSRPEPVGWGERSETHQRHTSFPSLRGAHRATKQSILAFFTRRRGNVDCFARNDGDGRSYSCWVSLRSTQPTNPIYNRRTPHQSPYPHVPLSCFARPVSVRREAALSWPITSTEPSSPRKRGPSPPLWNMTLRLRGDDHNLRLDIGRILCLYSPHPVQRGASTGDAN